MKNRAAPGKVALLTRQGCHLCHDALQVVRLALPDFDVILEVIDVDGDEELARLYGEELPVLLVDGEKAFKYRVDPDRLRRRLRRFRRPFSGGPVEE